MKLTLLSYWPLLLLVMGAVWIWWWYRRSRVTLDRRRLSVCLFLRVASQILLCAALCVPSWSWQSRSHYTVFALDVSESIADESIRSSLIWLRQMQERLGEDRSRLLVFARDARWLEGTDYGDLARLRMDLTIDQSGFQTVVKKALSAYPQGFIPRLVVVSDGRFPTGETRSAVLEARDRGVEIYAREVGPREDGDCWLQNARWPSILAVGQPATLALGVFCQAEAGAEIEVWARERRVTREDVMLRAGEQQITLSLQPDIAGLWVLQIRLAAAGDPFSANDFLNVSAWVHGRRAVWLLNGPGSSRSLLPEILRSQGFEVRSGPRMPSDFTASSWDVLVLNNVHPEQLTPGQMIQIREFASAGGGVVFLSGENSFGANGYTKTEIERILPVSFEIEEELGLALLLLMDKSNSMKGEKIELARQATLAMVEQLAPEQAFGLVAFDHQPRLVVPLQEVGDSKAAIRELIESINPGAHTNIMPALEQSYFLLSGYPAASRHIILLSDGRTYPDDYQGLVEEIQEAGISVSTVGIGRGADQELLRQIAEWGKGRSYFAPDPGELPKIFLEETLRMQSSLIEERLDLRVRDSAQVLSGIPIETAPPLLGLLQVKARPEADVILETVAEDPVLVRWRYGLGKVCFLAVDLGERFTTEWLKWPYLTRLASQLVRDSARPYVESPLEWSVERSDAGNARVELRARDQDGQPLLDLDPVLEVNRRDRVESHYLIPRGRGKYQADFPVPLDEPVFVRLVEPLAERVEAVLPQYPDEYRHLPPNHDLLKEICQESGGKLNPTDEDLFQSSSRRATRELELWPLLSGLALLSFLLEIGVRRWPS